MKNIYFTIPGFPGYTIDRNGIIRAAESDKAIAATRRGHTYRL